MLVTGGAVRVGRAIVLAFARAGADVCIHYRSSAAEAESVAAEARALGVRAATAQADQAEEGAPERLVSAAASALGGLDCLVCSAAAFERAPADELTRARWDAMLATNLTGPFFLAQAAHPYLRARRGCVVNLLDLCGTSQVWPGYAHYAASKAGLAALTRLLAVEWGPDVRVNAVAPGAVAFPEDMPEAERARLIRRIPAGRAGIPEDVASAVLFLASQPFVSGQVLAVDGGRSAAP